MKLKLLFGTLLLTFITTFSQSKQLAKFDTTGMETSFLFESMYDVDFFNDNSLNTHLFFQAYKTLKNGDLENKLEPLSEIKSKASAKIIPIPIVLAEVETIKKEAIENGLVFKNSQGEIERKDTTTPIFNQYTLVIATPLKTRSKGLQTSFVITNDFLINTTSKSIKNIQVNFDDGNGFIEIQVDKINTINYATIGKKTITTKIELIDSTVYQTSSTIKIEYSNTDLNSLFNRTIETFTSGEYIADLSDYSGANSFAGTGEYEIQLSSDGVLDKPIFLVDGFDPGDTRNIDAIYQLLNFDDGGTTENLGDLVKSEGFDIVILNFPTYDQTIDSNVVSIDGGADFIERNAMLLVKLIDILNTHPDRVGAEENVIIGPSMGGLISRYALNYMEAESLNHNTRLWLSFDAPHHGANVPIGFQHLFNYLAYGLDTWVGDFSLESLRPVVDGMLKSAAARQMLTDQFEPHLANGEIAEFNTSLTLPIAHPFKNIFYENLNELTNSGYPENLRKISIINGSGEGNPYQHQDGSDVEPGDKVLDAYIANVAFLTDAYFDVWLTPYKEQEIVVDDIWIDAPFLCFCDIYADAESRAFSYTDGIDAAPGGLFDLVSLATDFEDQNDPTIDAFFAALTIDYFNFIPTVSAMGLKINNNQIDWFHTPTNLITGRDVDNTTPFDAWYMPTNNEPHVQLTDDNVDFAWNEIVSAVLNTPEIINTNVFKLLKNPVTNTISVKTNSDIDSNINASIYTVTGQKILQKNITVTDTLLEIPIDLSSGIYIMELKNKNTVYKTKIIVQ